MKVGVNKLVAGLSKVKTTRSYGN